MARINPGIIFMTHDVDLVWDLLFSIIVNCANVICPVKIMKVRPNKLPWISYDILSLLTD